MEVTGTNKVKTGIIHSSNSPFSFALIDSAHTRFLGSSLLHVPSLLPLLFPPPPLTDSLVPVSSQEIFTGLVFLLMVLLWLTRSPGFFPGWSSLFPQ